MRPAATFTDARWNDLSQMTSVSHDGTVHEAEYASTDQSERTRFGEIAFHNGPVGLSGQTQAGVDMSFTRCPEGDLHGFRTGGKRYYYLADNLGSIEAVVDENGQKVNQYLYELFGAARPETTEQVPQPFRYAGGYQDPTLQYHLGARYLDPYVSRFTQPDPGGLELNPYLYATGDPTNRIDPTGLGCGANIIGGLTGVAGFVLSTAGMFATPLTGGVSAYIALYGYAASAAALGTSVGALFESGC